MPTTVEHLFQQALSLSNDKQTELVEALLEQTNPSISFLSEQLADIGKRRENVRLGQSHLTPAADAHQQVRESLQGL